MTIVLATCVTLGAQPAKAPDPLVGVKTKAEIDQIVKKIRSGELTGPQNLFERDKGQYRIYTSYIDNRKGGADIHVDDEVFVVLSGSAQVTLGGDITDKTSPSPNEFRGSVIAGGASRQIGAGDIVSVPRGVAHQMNPGTGHILYIVIKFTAHA